MERKQNYFMPHNGQIGFSPLHMLGLSSIHPKSMQHGFVDVSVNTHTMDNNFSLFKCKDQDNDIVNMKNKLMNPFGCGLPTGKNFSKLIGGFIGSKCLIGSSTGRENNFWGRVLQQYNNIIGTNSNLYISMSAMNTEENTGEYIKAGAVDAALLFSQSFNLFGTNNLISQEQTLNTTENLSTHKTPESSVEMQVQETINTEPKQSYAEVTKSGVVSKLPDCAASDRCSTVNKRQRPVRRNPVKLRQKKQSFSASSNNNWRHRDQDGFGKCADSTDYRREPHRKHCFVAHDTQRKSVSAMNSTKGTSQTSEDLKMNHSRTRRVQHSTSSRKLSGKRRLNSNLLSDIKEDCLGVDDNLMPFEKKVSYNHKFSPPLNKRLTPSNDHKSVSNHCANWRCRPYSLCDPCKVKKSYGTGNDVNDSYGPHIQHEAVTCEAGEKENKENNVPETQVTSLSERTPDVSSSILISCSDSSVTDCEILIATGHPKMRTRISSVCSVDSEDSFIIMFDASADDSYEETNSSETASVCSDSDSSDEDDDEDDDALSINSQCLTYELHSDDDNYEYDCDDEIDFDGSAELESLICISKTELKEANARWESAYEDIPSTEKEPEKVQFANTPELTTVHKIIAWDFAYRAARPGPWELIARDRIRFHRRIEHMNRILSPVLQDDHRRHVWQKFHKETLGVT